MCVYTILLLVIHLFSLLDIEQFLLQADIQCLFHESILIELNITISSISNARSLFSSMQVSCENVIDKRQNVNSNNKVRWIPQSLWDVKDEAQTAPVSTNSSPCDWTRIYLNEKYLPGKSIFLDILAQLDANSLSEKQRLLTYTCL